MTKHTPEPWIGCSNCHLPMNRVEPEDNDHEWECPDCGAKIWHNGCDIIPAAQIAKWREMERENVRLKVLQKELQEVRKLLAHIKGREEQGFGYAAAKFIADL